MKLLLGLLVLGLSLSGVAAAQSTDKRLKSSDSRTDVNSLPRSGSSLHFVSRSGSYVVTNNIQCGAGETAIEIGPAASSVVIEFNGFAISGTAAMTSVSAVTCPAAPAMRTHVQLIEPRAYQFGGDALSLESVESVVVSGGVVAACGGTGLKARLVLVVDTSGSMLFLQCGTGVDIGGAQSVTLSGVHVLGSGTGLVVASDDVALNGVSVEDCTGDGIVLVPPVNPGSSSLVRGRLANFKINGCAGRGVYWDCQRPGWVDLRSGSVTNCGLTGVEVVLGGSPPAGSSGGHTVSVDDVSVNGSGGSGMSINSSGSAVPVHVEIQNSRYVLSASRGIAVDCRGDELVIHNTDCDSNGAEGLFITNSSPLPGGNAGAVTLSSLRCSSNGLDGVSILLPPAGGGGAKVSMSDFHLVSNGRHGAQLSNVSYKGWDGTIKGCAQDGMRATGCTLALSSVSASDCGGDGFHVQTCPVSCRDIAVARCSTGLYSSGSSIDCGQLSVSDCTQDGVQLVASSYYKGWDGTIKGCGLDGLHAEDSQVDLLSYQVRHCVDGVRLDRSGAYVVELVVTDSTNHGILDTGLHQEPAFLLVVGRSVLANNGGCGILCIDKASPVLSNVSFNANASSGMRSTSSGACATVKVELRQCSFDANGGAAIDVQNAGGGVLDGCVVAGSPIGISLRDLSGGSCCTDVTVSGCSVTRCGTGMDVQAGAKHVITRNHVSSCTIAAFAVGAGNLIGPVISTSADMLTIQSPFANFAP